MVCGSQPKLHRYLSGCPSERNGVRDVLIQTASCGQAVELLSGTVIPPCGGTSAIIAKTTARDLHSQLLVECIFRGIELK